MLFAKPVSMTDALRYASAKRVLALTPDIGSRDVQQFIPASIRERSIFSARTPYVSYLAETQGLIQNIVQPEAERMPDGSMRRRERGQSVNPAKARELMKAHLRSLGYQPDPAKRGGLQDLSSDRRVNLIIDTQTKMARGYGSWRQSQDPTILNVWPADELYRAITRTKERDWQERWNAERRRLGGRTSATLATTASGPFVALKNDPIWTAISRFGNPYPPFDYRSGMRVRDVTRARAIQLKVLAAEQRVAPQPDPLPKPIEMNVASIPSALRAALSAAFGGHGTVIGDVLRVTGVS